MPSIPRTSDPPGWYPTATVNGTPVFSTFAQLYTGTLTDGDHYTIGDLVTPTGAYTTPKSSNCVTTSSIANHVNIANGSGSNTASATATGNGGSKITTAAATSTPTGSTTGSSSASSPSKSSAARSGNINAQVYPLVALWSFFAGIGAVMLLH